MQPHCICIKLGAVALMRAVQLWFNVTISAFAAFHAAHTGANPNHVPRTRRLQLQLFPCLTTYCKNEISGVDNGIIENVSKKLQINNYNKGIRLVWPCHSSGGYSPASHRGVPCSSLGQNMWDLLWTGFLRVLPFPLPILIPPTAPHS
jgi:hypothetical protein